MEVHSPTTEAGGDGSGALPAPGTTAADETYRPFWWAATRLFRWRWFIIGVTVLVAVLSVVLSLQLPNVYRARTTVLLPSDNGGGLAGSLLGLPPSAQALLGSGGGDYTRYLAILTSRTVAEQAVETFDLVEAYELTEEDYPHEAAVEAFTENVDFPLSLEFNHLGVEVVDLDPERAARIANYLVEVLNREHIRLTSSSAGERRSFLETRLNEAELALDSARSELQAIQERYGVVEIESQAQALMSSLAEAQATVSQAEVAYQTLLSQYGAENAEVQAAAAGLQAARQQVNQLTGGGKSVMPVPLRSLPAVSRRYAVVMQELLTQTEILQVVRPLYEEAAISERRESSAVQVLDEAVPPVRKDAPRRSIIVLLATLSAGLLAVAFSLVWCWWREQGRGHLERLIFASRETAR